MTNRETESGVNEARTTSIRPAEPQDVPALLALVHELAIYEKAPEAVEATEAHFRQALFPPEHGPTAFAHVAVVDGTVVGMAIWYITFSTWLGSTGVNPFPVASGLQAPSPTSQTAFTWAPLALTIICPPSQDWGPVQPWATYGM